jgi:small multidrug resistance pump
MAYVYLMIAIVGEVIGTSMLKTSEGMSKLWPTCASILAYAVTFYFLSLTLKTIPTGIAYAIWSGVGIVLITAIGWVFFKQALDAAAICGLGLILAGVLVIQLLSKVSVH